MSEWWEISPNGLPSAGRLPKSCHRMAAEKTSLPRRWDMVMVPADLGVIGELSVWISILARLGIAQASERPPFPELKAIAAASRNGVASRAS